MSDLFVGFYDTSSDTLLTPLEDGAIIPSSTLTETTTLVVEINPTGTLAGKDRSVVLSLSDGTTVYTRQDNKVPYTQFGDGGGDLTNGIDLAPGNYEFIVEVYSRPAGKGDLLGSFTYSFSVANLVNSPPVATDDSGLTTPFETALQIDAATLLANDSDADDDALTVVAVDGAAGGTVALAGDTVTFTPDTGFSGQASFTYDITDGNGGTATATVALTVGANTPPVISSLDEASSETFVQGGDAILLDADVDISDAELDALEDYDTASLSIRRSSGADQDDEFGFDTTGASFFVDVANGLLQSAGQTFATFTLNAGELTVNFASSATPTLVDEVVRRIDYANTSVTPPASVSLDYSFDDGAGASNSVVTETILVNIDANIAPIVIQSRVSNGEDDAEEDTSSGDVSLSSSDLELGDDISKLLDQIVGLRFNGLDIMQGAVVTRAYIQFQVDEVSAGAALLQISGEDVDNATAFTGASGEMSTRLQNATAATVTWSPSEWLVVGEAGPNQRTVDISNIVQQIVSRDGWASGNSLALLISGTGERTAESFNGDAAGAPLLHIEYLPAGPPPVFNPDADPAANEIAEDAPEGTLVGITASATDPDGGASTYSIVDERFVIDEVTGVVTRSALGELDFESEPTIALDVIAKSSESGIATQPFTIAVSDVNEAPYVATPISEAFAPQDQEFTLSVAANFADDDTSHGDTLTFSAFLADGGALPGWLSFDSTTGTFTGTPTGSDAGEIDITVTASDANGPLSVSDTFTLNVAAIGGPGSIYIVGRSDVFATIQDAVDAAISGDTVLVGKGSYDADITISGKSITLASEYYLTGDASFIDETVINGGEYGILIEPTAAGTIIQGLHFIGGADGVVSYAQNVMILENTFESIIADAVSIEEVGGIVRDNRFILSGDDAIDIDNPTSEVLIEGNSLEFSDDDGIEIRNMAYNGPLVEVIIRDNIIVGSGEDGIQIIDYPELSDRRFVIERNLIRDSHDVGLGIMDDGETVEDYRAASMPERVHVFNNTFDGNDYGITGGDNLIAVNNIISNVKYIGMKNVDGNSIVEHTLFFGNTTDQSGSNVSPVTTQIGVDPLYTEDFLLQSSSPAIDYGTASYNYNGSELVLSISPSEYSGSSPDLGWDEFNLF